MKNISINLEKEKSNKRQYEALKLSSRRDDQKLYDSLWKNKCMFCLKEIKTKTEENLRTHVTRDHYYEEEYKILHVTHYPAENIIGFKIELEKKSNDLMQKYIMNNNTKMKSIISKIKGEHHPSRIFQNIYDKINIPDVEIDGNIISMSGYKESIITGMEVTILEHLSTYESNAKKELNEFLFHTERFCGKNSEYHEHRQDIFLPDTLKSHIGCYPFDKKSGKILDYKEFYQKIEGKIPLSTSTNHPEILEKLLDSKIRIVYQ